MAPKEKRVGLIGIVVLILFSLFFDGLEIIFSLTGIGVVVAWIVVIVKWILFWITLKLAYNINLTKGNLRKATLGLTALVGAVPLLNMLPEFTIGLILLLFTNYLETNYPKVAKVTNAITRSKRGGATPPPIPNQGGDQSSTTRQRRTPPPIPNSERQSPPIPKDRDNIVQFPNQRKQDDDIDRLAA